MQLERIVAAARPFGAAAGPLALASAVGAVAAETAGGGMEMAGSVVLLAGVLGLVGSLCLLISLAALLVATQEESRIGTASFLAVVIGAALSVGAAWSLAFVVPGLVDKAPALVNDPPASIPIGYIISYAILGLATLFVGIKLKRARIFSAPLSVAFIIGAVLCITPLPGRFFLLGFAAGRMLWLVSRERATGYSVAPARG